MHDCWSILGIDPTNDEAAIKQAYAQQSRSCNPEEDPQGFMALRKAYQQALAARKGEDMAQTDTPEAEGPEGETIRLKGLEDRGDNPYRNSDLFQKFVKLYKKENQKNWKLWMEYFTSPDFLALRYDEDLCALLLEQVKSQQEVCKPGAEFTKTLYLIYNMVFDGVYLDGIHYHKKDSGTPLPAPMEDLFAMLPERRRYTGNDMAMEASLEACEQLWAIDRGPGWDDQGLHALREVVQRHCLSYIRDSVPTPSFADPKAADLLRHPLGLRLLTHFFATAHLTEEGFQIAWEVLDLKNAKMGRPGVLYGPLRAVCLERCPQLEYSQQEKFSQLRTAFYEQCAWQEGADVETFFAREDLQRALLNRKFIEEDVRSWIKPDHSTEFLQRLADFYRSHPTAPFARELVEGLEESLILRVVQQQNQEDEEAPANPDRVTLQQRPFLRHWLATAFPRFRSLQAMAHRWLPCSERWVGQLFADRGEGGGAVRPICRQVVLGDKTITVLIHRFYVDYWLGETALFAPCIPLHQVLELGEKGLWLLPIATVPQGMDVELLSIQLERALLDLPVPQQQEGSFARAMAYGMVEWNREEDEPPVVLFGESCDRLYGAEISPDYREASQLQEEDEDRPEQDCAPQLVHLFSVSEGEPQFLPDVLGPFWTWGETMAQAQSAVDQLIAPPPLTFFPPEGQGDRSLPDQVYYTRLYSPEALWEPAPEALRCQRSAMQFWQKQRDACSGSTRDLLAALEESWDFWEKNCQGQSQFATGLRQLVETGTWAQMELPQGLEEAAARLDMVQAALRACGDGHQARLLAGLHCLGQWDWTGAEKAEAIEGAFVQQVCPLLDQLQAGLEEIYGGVAALLDALLAAFAAGELSRLELAFRPRPWEVSSQKEYCYQPMFSLVFCWTNGGAACLYFRDPKEDFWALAREEKRAQWTPYQRLSHDEPIPQDCIFGSFFPLHQHLRQILDLIQYRRQPDRSAPKPYYWKPAWGGVFVGDKLVKYNLAKREVGDFPLERAATPLDAQLALRQLDENLNSLPPMEMELWPVEGERAVETLEQNRRVRLTQAVTDFFDGKLTRLRLSWQVDPAAYAQRLSDISYQQYTERMEGRTPMCHLILMGDGQSMMLLCMQDFTRQAEYYVADQTTYLDVECNNKYPKGQFMGKTVPAYLLHTDPLFLRNHLDLMLEHLQCPYILTTRFAEYTEEKPVKARAYEVIRAEMLGQE